MDIWTQLLSSLNLNQLSSNAILALVALFIFTGKLQWHTVGDAWKDLYFREQRRNDSLLQQNAELIDAGRVTAKVLDSLPGPLGGEPDDLEATTATRRRRRQAGSAAGDSGR